MKDKYIGRLIIFNSFFGIVTRESPWALDEYYSVYWFKSGTSGDFYTPSWIEHNSATK